jgi:hypothetical protein
MGTGGNFNETLDVVFDRDKGFHVVMAGGPLKKSVTRVIELCVWVFQRAGDPAADDDAIANAMGPGTGTVMDNDKGSADMAHTKKLKSDDAHWELVLDDRDETENRPFVDGSATAVAIGAFLDNSLGDEKRRAFVWSEPVTLRVKPDDAAQA